MIETPRALQRFKPREMWTYTVSYYDRDDLRTSGEYAAKRLTTRMNATELYYFMKSAAIVVESAFLDYTTVFF